MFGLEKAIKEQITWNELIQQRNAYEKTYSVIKGCNKLKELITAGNMLKNYEIMYGSSLSLTRLFHVKSIALN